MQKKKPIKNTNNPTKTWANDLNGHFSKEDVEIVNRYMRRYYSMSLVIREMKIKATTK